MEKASKTADLEKFLTPEEFANLIGVEVDTVNDWRYKGIGPAFHKLGKVVRYHPIDIRTWTDARRHQPSVLSMFGKS